MTEPAITPFRGRIGIVADIGGLVFGNRNKHHGGSKHFGGSIPALVGRVGAGSWCVVHDDFPSLRLDGSTDYESFPITANRSFSLFRSDVHHHHHRQSIPVEFDGVNYFQLLPNNVDGLGL
jgi:hypothetical protein